MRPVDPFTPSWYLRNGLAIAAGVAVMVVLDSLWGGSDRIGWTSIVVFTVVMVVAIGVTGRAERRTRGRGRPFS